DAAFMSKARVRLEELVKRSGILVFASHSNDFLAQLCNTALWIDKGEIRSAGEVADVVGEYEGPEVGEYVRDMRERFERKTPKAYLKFAEKSANLITTVGITPARAAVFPGC